MPYIESAVRSRQVVTAARSVLMRDGVAGTTMRAVAAEAAIPLGTLQYVFPNKQGLLKAVIEDVVDEVAEILRYSADPDAGLEDAIRQGLQTFWAELVTQRSDLQLAQYELVNYALRTPGLEQLARWQYERYVQVVSEWTEQAARQAGQTCAIPFVQLARIMVASIDGLIIQHVIDPDPRRSADDLQTAIDMLADLATRAPGQP